MNDLGGGGEREHVGARAHLVVDEFWCHFQLRIGHLWRKGGLQVGAQQDHCRTF